MKIGISWLTETKEKFSLLLTSIFNYIIITSVLGYLLLPQYALAQGKYPYDSAVIKFEIFPIAKIDKYIKDLTATKSDNKDIDAHYIRWNLVLVDKYSTDKKPWVIKPIKTLTKIQKNTAKPVLADKIEVAGTNNNESQTVEGYPIKFVTITAYSSTPDQTDSSPFITASNQHVRDGIIASNFLPFHTRVKFPDLFGDKEFIVEDRMKSNVKVDIWMPDRQSALKFGVKYSKMVILGK